MTRLTTICLSRLLLNLRDVALISDIESTSTSQEVQSQLSTLNFSPSRVLGPLGNSLDDGLSYHDMRGDEDCVQESTDSAAASEAEVEGPHE